MTTQIQEADIAPTVRPLDVPVLPAEPSHDPVLAILRNARDAVSKRWARHDYRKSNGAVCAVAGICAGEGDVGPVGRQPRQPRSPEGQEAMLILGRALCGIKFRSPNRARRAIIDRNDEIGTNKRDIVAAYAKAIENRKAAE